MWRHIGKSVRGGGHSSQDAPRQDNCLVRVFGDGPEQTLVACVADGAGTAAHSEIGSELACQSFVDCAAERLQCDGTLAQLDEPTLLEWCDAIRRAIAEHAEQHGRPLRDYATTLCAAIVAPTRAAFLQIGDGAIVVKNRATMGVVFWPQSGEYINTTYFITSPEFPEQVQTCFTAGGVSDLALLTDGIERLALRFDQFTAHPPFFQPLFQALRDSDDVEALERGLQQFLQSKPVEQKSDDDKTLVLASWVAPGGRGDD